MEEFHSTLFSTLGSRCFNSLIQLQNWWARLLSDKIADRMSAIILDSPRFLPPDGDIEIKFTGLGTAGGVSASETITATPDVHYGRISIGFKF